jgi:hypothetical protein
MRHRSRSSHMRWSGHLNGNVEIEGIGVVASESTAVRSDSGSVKSESASRRDAR